MFSTLQETILANYQAGYLVNLEIDLIARYLERLLQGEHAAEPNSHAITAGFLAEHGFMRS